METFPVYSENFQLYPDDAEPFRLLSPLLSKLQRIDFELSVVDPNANRGQMKSNFDEALESALLRSGVSSFDLPLPSNFSQKLDFAFIFSGSSVAVEIEKTNREKILRDFLKCHMYLHFGADFAMVGLAKNYPHRHGVWNLFDFGVQRFRECKTYGFGTANKLDRIVLLGFEQFSAQTNEPLSKTTREEMRKQAQQEGVTARNMYGPYGPIKGS